MTADDSSWAQSGVRWRLWYLARFVGFVLWMTRFLLVLAGVAEPIPESPAKKEAAWAFMLCHGAKGAELHR